MTALKNSAYEYFRIAIINRSVTCIIPPIKASKPSYRNLFLMVSAKMNLFSFNLQQWFVD